MNVVSVGATMNAILAAVKSDGTTIIENAAKDAGEENRSIVKQQTQDYVKELEKAGMEIFYPELQPFREATTGVLDMFRAVYGEDLISFVTEYK